MERRTKQRRTRGRPGAVRRRRQGHRVGGRRRGLVDAGYLPQRILGTSAGALVGAVVAAAVQRGQVCPRSSKSWRWPSTIQFLDPGPSSGSRCSARSGASCPATASISGDALHDWVRPSCRLRRLHVADLAISTEPAPRPALSAGVTVADVTLGQLVGCPGTTASLWARPRRQSVADAVRASTAIPFFFRPGHTDAAPTGTESTLVDGGLLSNFPIDSLDRTDGRDTAVADFRRHPAARPARRQRPGDPRAAAAAPLGRHPAEDRW